MDNNQDEEWMYWAAIGYTLAKAIYMADDIGKRIDETKRKLDQLQHELDEFAAKQEKRKRWFLGW